MPAWLASDAPLHESQFSKTRSGTAREVLRVAGDYGQSPSQRNRSDPEIRVSDRRFPAARVPPVCPPYRLAASASKGNIGRYDATRSSTSCTNLLEPFFFAPNINSPRVMLDENCASAGTAATLA